MEQKAKTRALLAAFGCALAYLLAGKVLAFLPAPAWDVRALRRDDRYAGAAAY